MTTEMSPALDYRALVQRFLGNEANGLPANWPLQAVLQAAGMPRKLALERSAYPRLLQDALELILEDLRAGGAHWLSAAEIIFLAGPESEIAGPYRLVIAGVLLPPETNRLMGLIYDWIFTSLGKSHALNGTRFLDDDLTTPLVIRIYISNPETFSDAEVTGQLKAAFQARLNFSPSMVCQIRGTGSFSTRTALTGRCLYGWEYVENHLRESWAPLNESDLQVQFQHAVAVTRHALKSAGTSDAGALHQAQTAVNRRIVAHYRQVKFGDKPSVSLDLLAPVRNRSNGWYKKNREFFQHILNGRYDRLLVEDATKSLGDTKGAEKENRYTISRVLALEFEGQVVPANDVVLKLRGFSHYRGDFNNMLDLLKEYMSYVYIHQRVPRDPGYLLEIGPLLLTCEDLELPFDRAEKSRWIGIFMESLSFPAEGRVFTCRVRNISDFWAPGKVVGRVLRAAHREGVLIEERSLRVQLRKLALWLWEHGLSINYCDLVLGLDPGGQVDSARIIDLERLSFSELVGENHLVLDTWIDVKTHLRKEPWVHVLVNMFRSREDPQGFPSLAALQNYLNPRSRWRQARLWFWRSLRRGFLGLDSNLGARLWLRIIALRAHLGDLFS